MAWEVDLGLEQEYSFVVGKGGWDGVDLDEMARFVMDELDRMPQLNSYRLDGGRCYLDQGVVERTTAETKDPRAIALRIRVCDEEIVRATHAASVRYSRHMGREITILAVKSAADPHGNTRGCHENLGFPLDYTREEAELVRLAMLPFFAARPYYTERGSVVPDGDSWGFAIAPKGLWISANGSAIAGLKGGLHGKRIRLEYRAHGPNDSDAMNEFKFAMTSLVFTSVLRRIRADKAALGNSLPLLLADDDPGEAFRTLNGLDRGRRIPVQLHGRIQWKTAAELLDFYRADVAEQLTDLDEPQLEALRKWDRIGTAMLSEDHVDALAQVEWVGMNRMMVQASRAVTRRDEPPLGYDDVVRLQTGVNVLESDPAKLAKRDQHLYGVRTFGRIFTQQTVNDELERPSASETIVLLRQRLVERLGRNAPIHGKIRMKWDSFRIVGKHKAHWFSLVDVKPGDVDALVDRIIVATEHAGPSIEDSKEVDKYFDEVLPGREQTVLTAGRTCELPITPKLTPARRASRWARTGTLGVGGWLSVLLVVPRIFGWAHDIALPDQDVVKSEFTDSFGDEHQLDSASAGPNYDTESLNVRREVERALGDDDRGTVALEVEAVSPHYGTDGYVAIQFRAAGARTSAGRPLRAFAIDQQPDRPIAQAFADELTGDTSRVQEIKRFLPCNQADEVSRRISLSILTEGASHRIADVDLEGCKVVKFDRNRAAMRGVADEAFGY